MNIHEHQAKELLRGYKVSVPKGEVAFTVDQAVAAAEKLGGPIWVVKAQIHAGGRGKGGGVKVVKSIEDVKAEAQRMLGMTLVTHQTGPQGKEVSRIYIEDGSVIARELYISLLVDRASGCPTFIASTEGGMDIEEVAHHTPEKIIKVAIDPVQGFQPYHSRKIAFALKLEGDQIKACNRLLAGIFQMFHEKDAAMVEVNPLVVTQSGELLVLDAKIGFDDNALFRHLDIEALRDETEENPAEREATKHELNYVKLDGNVGCMVNGAGLAMATMDIIKFYGGDPANFLDVGGGATKERVTTAFKLILSDQDVKGILVNIFGGIMRCDIIAEGILAAARDVNLSVPLVVRLEGTNVELGKKILKESGLAIEAANDLADAAQKIVHAVKGAV
jgi:succinyl-CoA synthetase beta subunit